MVLGFQRGYRYQPTETLLITKSVFPRNANLHTTGAVHSSRQALIHSRGICEEAVFGRYVYFRKNISGMYGISGKTLL